MNHRTKEHVKHISKKMGGGSSKQWEKASPVNHPTKMTKEKTNEKRDTKREHTF